MSVPEPEYVQIILHFTDGTKSKKVNGFASLKHLKNLKRCKCIKKVEVLYATPK